jgi:hypothetical protein
MVASSVFDALTSARLGAEVSTFGMDDATGGEEDASVATGDAGTGEGVDIVGSV